MADALGDDWTLVFYGHGAVLVGESIVATHKDIPDTRRGQEIHDCPILPVERVQYIGGPVAVVA